jgi:hypothetical protein
VNKEEVLNSSDINEVYEYLKTQVYDPQHLLSLERIKNAMNYDKNILKKEQSCFGFNLDKEEKQYISLDVFYNE